MKVDVAHLAKLSRLKIQPEQEATYEAQMQDIIAMVEKLPELTSADSLVDPEHPMEFRKDIAGEAFRREDILKNAPKTQAGCVVVPKVVD